MAHHKSAEKRHNQSVRRRAQNRIVKSAMRTQLKKARAEIDEGKADGTKGEVLDAIKHIANLSRKNILHRKAASRRISRLMKAANKSAK